MYKTLLQLKQVKREINESSKDAFIESLKRKNKKLEDDNKQLREHLKFSYRGCSKSHQMISYESSTPACFSGPHVAKTYISVLKTAPP